MEKHLQKNLAGGTVIRVLKQLWMKMKETQKKTDSKRCKNDEQQQL